MLDFIQSVDQQWIRSIDGISVLHGTALGRLSPAPLRSAVATALSALSWAGLTVTAFPQPRPRMPLLSLARVLLDELIFLGSLLLSMYKMIEPTFCAFNNMNIWLVHNRR